MASAVGWNVTSRSLSRVLSYGAGIGARIVTERRGGEEYRGLMFGRTRRQPGEHPGARPLQRGEPPWWVRDGVVALLIGGVLLGGQALIDDGRSDREAARADDLAMLADRRENLRFVRERSTVVALERPFQGMDLTEQNLSGLSLSGANFGNAELDDTSFFYADLKNTDFSGASLEDSFLSFTDLTDANLAVAELNGAFLTDAVLVDTNFGYAVADRARFTSADVTDAFFDGASLRNADFDEVDLSTVLSFDRVDLTGAQLHAATFGELELVAICYDETTTWPVGVDPPPSDPDVCAEAIQLRSE